MTDKSVLQVVACSNEGGILNEILKEMSTMKQAIKDVQEIQEREFWEYRFMFLDNSVYNKHSLLK